MSKQKDDLIESEWLAIQRQLDPGETEASRTLDNLAVLRAGWHRTRGAKGEFAFFPDVPVLPQDSREQRQLESDWEIKSEIMHAAQEPLQNLAPKVAEGDTAGRGHFTLKITPNEPDPGIPKYEDSAHSRESRRQANAARELKRS